MEMEINGESSETLGKTCPGGQFKRRNILGIITALPGRVFF